MKKQFLSTAVAAFILTAALFNLTSCEKDEGKLPAISFKTTAGYTSADKNVNSGDAILVGINAAKTEDEDVLKTFNIQHNVISGSAITDTTIVLTSADEDSFSKDFTLTPTGVSGDKVKYTFTVSNRDGLVNNVYFTLTIN
jgi:hypothetical protein